MAKGKERGWQLEFCPPIRHIQPTQDSLDTSFVQRMEDLAPFIKMNGLGNEIIIADMRGRADRVTPPAAVALASDPMTQFDQIMAIHDPQSAGTDQSIEILNADGSQAQTCGNGLRCVVRFLSRESGRKKFRFGTLAGELDAEVLADGLISVDMGKPRFRWNEIPLAHEVSDTDALDLHVGPSEAPLLHSPAALSMGNPHVVFWVEEDVDSFALERHGPMLENHPLFPERANISLARIEGPDHVRLRTWERGAGLTLACGSAACAAAVSAIRSGRTGRKVRVTLPGGTLSIEWREDGHVIMTGPAEFEFQGRFDPSTGRWRRAEGAA